MKRGAVVVMVVALMSGCLGSRSNNRKLAIVTSVAGGAGLAVAGYIGMFSLFPPADGCSYDDSCNPPPTDFAKKLAIGSLALVATSMTVLLIGETTYSAEQEPPPPWKLEWDRKQQAAERARDDAWAVTKVAARAARDGDCAYVTSLSARVRQLDEGIHRSTFSRDVAIQWCLGPPAAPAPPPPPPRDRIKDRERAFAITKTASKAARAGRCSDALAVEAQVRELDANVHDAWFVRDEAIKQCLAPPTP